MQTITNTISSSKQKKQNNIEHNITINEKKPNNEPYNILIQIEKQTISNTIY